METPETLENKGLRIKYVVTGSISMEHFSNRCSYSRHLVGDNRDVLAKQLENSSPSNYHYSPFRKNFCCKTWKLQLFTFN